MAAKRYPSYAIPSLESEDETPEIFYTPPDIGDLPLKEIPGSYGLPFVGPIMDRWDFFYNQGRDEFFQARKDKYKSTVFRANAPPGPFNAKNPKVVVLLDGASFPILFDNSKVEKKDLFVGTYMPSVGFNGGYRILSYLDTTEPKHRAIKRYFLSLLASKHDSVIPTLQKTVAEVYTTLETQLKTSKAVELNKITDPKALDYVFSLFFGKHTSETPLGASANKTVDVWLILQLIPLKTLSPPAILRLVEDFLLHTFPIPPILAKSKYAAIYKTFTEVAKDLLDQAESFGIPREEAQHNLIFFLCFNIYGGVKPTFPHVFKWLGRAGPTWHANIAREVRAAVKQEGGLTPAALEKMPLLKSFVYEAFRIEPLVPYQYAHAREDLVIQSHDASYKIKKGEMLFGYQPFATKDPKIFEKPEEFIPYRFRGKAEENLKYVYWSNGRQTDAPTEDNKQCMGRDMAMIVARVIVAEFFLRYDTFTSTDKPFLVGSTVTFSSLTKATPEFTKTK